MYTHTVHTTTLTTRPNLLNTDRCKMRIYIYWLVHSMFDTMFIALC